MQPTGSARGGLMLLRTPRAASFEVESNRPRLVSLALSTRSSDNAFHRCKDWDSLVRNGSAEIPMPRGYSISSEAAESRQAAVECTAQLWQQRRIVLT